MNKTEFHEQWRHKTLTKYLWNRSYTGNWLYAYHGLLETPLDREAPGLSLHSLLVNLALKVISKNGNIIFSIVRNFSFNAPLNNEFPYDQISEIELQSVETCIARIVYGEMLSCQACSYAGPLLQANWYNHCVSIIKARNSSQFSSL